MPDPVDARASEGIGTSDPSGKPIGVHAHPSAAQARASRSSGQDTRPSGMTEDSR